MCCECCECCKCSEDRKAYLKAYEETHPKCSECGQWHIPDCARSRYENSQAYRDEISAWFQRYPNQDHGD